MNVKYACIYADDAGESHFRDVEVELRENNFAPPALPLYVSAFYPATQWCFLSASVGWFGDWHPTPRRQVLFYLAGQVEVRASDGEARTFKTGDILLAEDTTGKGHVSRALGSIEALHAVVQLPN